MSSYGLNSLLVCPTGELLGVSSDGAHSDDDYYSDSSGAARHRE